MYNGCGSLTSGYEITLDSLILHSCYTLSIGVFYQKVFSSIAALFKSSDSASYFDIHNA